MLVGLLEKSQSRNTKPGRCRVNPERFALGFFFILKPRGVLEVFLFIEWNSVSAIRTWDRW